MKHLFCVKIWFVKTSARIVKYESQVVKLNPVYYHEYHSTWNTDKEERKRKLATYL